MESIYRRKRTIILCILIASFSFVTFIAYSRIEINNPSWKTDDLDVLSFEEKLVIRRSILKNHFFSSITPWKYFDDSADLIAFPLEKYPELPFDQNISCLPRKFGYSTEEANQLFDKNRKFARCGAMHKSFMKIINDKLTLNCKSPNSPEFVIGKKPELFGNVNYEFR